MMDPNRAYLFADSYLSRGVQRVDTLAAIFDPGFLPHKVLSLGTHSFAAQQHLANEGGRAGDKYVALPPAASNRQALVSAHRQLVHAVTSPEESGVALPAHVYRQRLAECRGLSHLIETFNELILRGKEAGLNRPVNLHVATTYYVVCLHHFMATANLSWLTTRQDATLSKLSQENRVALHCTACERLGHLAGQPGCSKTPRPGGGWSSGGGRGGGGGPGPGRSYSGYGSRQAQREDYNPNGKGA